MNSGKLERLLPILRSPISGAPLALNGDFLVSESGERFPIVDGKPILVRRIKPLHMRAPEARHVSQTRASFILPGQVAAIPGFKLNLGSGNVPSQDDNVISLDVLPNTNVDIVAESEHLPFADDSIVYAASVAVFEHLWDPLLAVSELKRVLAPGGMFNIDTALMQGYHGYPSHYFNMTSQATETYLIDDFELIASGVPEGCGPATAVELLLRRFIDALPRADRIRFLSMRTADLMAELAASTSQTPAKLDSLVSEHMRRSLGTSTYVIGRKPKGYRPSRSNTADGEAELLAEAKREYYAARVGVIERHHEVEYYRNRTKEIQPDAEGPAVEASLDELLERGKPQGQLGLSAWIPATRTLQELDDSLAIARDAWQSKYLSLAPQPDRISALDDPSSELAAIKGSRAWKMALLLRRIYRIFLPATRRIAAALKQ